MTRRFIVSLLTAALFLSPIAAVPARADGEDVAKVIASIAALALIGKAIDDRRDRKKSRKSHVVRDRHYVDDRYDRRIERRQVDRHRSKRIVPARCLRRVDTRNGIVRVLGARCLYRNMHNAHRLPGYCEQTLRTNGRHRTVFGARCLRQNGWRIG